jgi:hypothetical protein
MVATTESGDLHRDTVALNSATSRKRFAKAILRKVFTGMRESEWPADAWDKLDEQLLAYARVPPGPPETNTLLATPTEDLRAIELAKMPDEVRGEAEALLSDPKLLERVSADIRALGVVGEKENGLILYLVGTSAQLPRPLAAITRGSSSSGKSFVTEQVATLFPPEVVLHATSLTTNSLYYFKPGTLCHRWVVAGERSRVEDDTTAEATRALREMIESGQLSKALPIKEADQLVTKVINQPGPIAYSETTTLNNVFPEDANRCLMLDTDEGQDQTQRILEATAAAAAGLNLPDVGHFRAVHHAVQRMLPRTDVVIPFARGIAAHYPTDRLEVRRDFRHLLQLVKACALLHFRQRERTHDGKVVATFDDYAIAERLAREPLCAVVSGMSESARAYLHRLREEFGDRQFDTTEAKRLGGASERSLYGHLLALNNAGAVVQTAPQRGRVAATWKLTGLEPEATESILPTLAQVVASAECQRTDEPQPQLG